MYVSSTAVALLLLHFLPSAGGTGDACNADDLLRLQNCVRRLVNALRYPLDRDVICTEEMTDDIECISGILQECQGRTDIANTHAKISPLLEKSQSKLEEFCHQNDCVLNGSFQGTEGKTERAMEESFTTEVYDSSASTTSMASYVMTTFAVLFCVMSWSPWLLLT